MFLYVCIMLCIELRTGEYVFCSQTTPPSVGDLVAERLITGKYGLARIEEQNDIDPSCQYKVLARDIIKPPNAEGTGPVYTVDLTGA